MGRGKWVEAPAGCVRACVWLALIYMCVCLCTCHTYSAHPPKIHTMMWLSHLSRPPPVYVCTTHITRGAAHLRSNQSDTTLTHAALLIFDQTNLMRHSHTRRCSSSIKPIPHRTVLAVEGEPLARLLLISHGRVQASVNQVRRRGCVCVSVGVGGWAGMVGCVSHKRPSSVVHTPHIEMREGRHV